METIKKITLACCLFWIATVNITDLSQIAVNSFLAIFETYKKIINGLNFSPDSEEDCHVILRYIELDELLSVDGQSRYRIIPVQIMPTETQLIEQGALERETLQIRGENASYKKKLYEILGRRTETREKILLVVFQDEFRRFTGPLLLR